MKAVNMIALLLLVVIGIGVYTVPKFNYEVLVARQTKLESQLYTFQDRLSKIDWTSGTKEVERRAALGVIDTLPATITQLRTGLGTVSEELAVIHAELAEHGAELRKLEGQAKEPTERKESALPLEVATYTQPIKLALDLADKAKRLSARIMAERTLDDVLPQLAEAGIIGGPGESSLTQEAIDRIGQRLHLLKVNLSLIDAEQNLYIQELVEQKTSTGDFSDVPNSGGTIIEKDVLDGPGIRFVKIIPEVGIKRVFAFPLEDYPEMDVYNELRQNVRDHFVRDVALVATSLVNKN